MIKLLRYQKTRLIAGAAIVILMLAATLVSPRGDKGTANTAAKAAKAALSVTVTQAIQSEWPMTLSANGNIAAWQEAIVGTEAGGLRLEEVLVNVGDQVKRDQLLARLQSVTISSELEQTRSTL